MYKKKSSLLIVAVLLLSMVLTGCNANTLGFMNHMKEMQTVMAENPTQTISTLSIGNIKVPSEMFDAEEAAMLTTVNKFFANSYIAITQKSDPKNNMTWSSIDLVESTTKKTENLVTLKYKDEAIAFSIGPKLNELIPSANMVLAPLNNKLIPFSMIEEYFTDTPMVLSALSNPKTLEGLEGKSVAFLDQFVEIYKSADTDLISKDGNDFILHVDADDFIKLIDTFVTLTLKNLDPILDATIDFIDSLTAEEFNAVYANMFPEGKQAIVDMLKESKEALTEEGLADMAVPMWNEIYPEVADTMSTMLAGSSLRVRAWKENNNFYTNLYSVVKITDPDDPTMVLSTTILVKEKTEILTEAFDVTMPTEKVSKELMDALLKTI